ncbi:hypothetical protein N780_03760 [Pontibacillus chungwhensis BH030062]|uniref:Uncharacterized protein n=1 Tax=Pontibacillus chungwhensis BH030062 TaxID=1385513 RepID=A0A0A2UQG3_9BACI|nr:hypothetical protein [Pontibacillus chungwhensis]KGP90532.1 hypothetical protein N780_03760 [Pontibacillus chungwhensis BH030062]
MDFLRRWSGVAILVLLALLSFSKGLKLWSLGTNIDGDGIGVYFFLIEITDLLPEERIPTYAAGFFILSLVALIISIAMIRENIVKVDASQ